MNKVHPEDSTVGKKRNFLSRVFPFILKLLRLDAIPKQERARKIFEFCFGLFLSSLCIIYGIILLFVGRNYYSGSIFLVEGVVVLILSCLFFFFRLKELHAFLLMASLCISFILVLYLLPNHRGLFNNIAVTFFAIVPSIVLILSQNIIHQVIWVVIYFTILTSSFIVDVVLYHEKTSETLALDYAIYYISVLISGNVLVVVKCVQEYLSRKKEREILNILQNVISFNFKDEVMQKMLDMDLEGSHYDIRFLLSCLVKNTKEYLPFLPENIVCQFEEASDIDHEVEPKKHVVTRKNTFNSEDSIGTLAGSGGRGRGERVADEPGTPLPDNMSPRSDPSDVPNIVFDIKPNTLRRKATFNSMKESVGTNESFGHDSFGHLDLERSVSERSMEPGERTPMDSFSSQSTIKSVGSDLSAQGSSWRLKIRKASSVFSSRSSRSFTSTSSYGEITQKSGIKLSQKEQTIMVCDIEDFNVLLSTILTEDLIYMHSKYTEEVAKIIKEENGVVHTFLGDKIVASFNCTKVNVTHEIAACKAALKIVKMVNTTLGNSFENKKLPRIKVNIGIVADTIYCGTLGSKSIKRYSHVGDAINEVFGLVKVSKNLNTEVLVNEAVFEKARYYFELKQVDVGVIRGKIMEIHVLIEEKTIKGDEWNYEIRDMLQKNGDDDIKKIWGLYTEGKIQEALKMIENIEEEHSMIPKELTKVKKRLQNGTIMGHQLDMQFPLIQVVCP